MTRTPQSKSIRGVSPPIESALLLVCEKCGKRAGGSGKNPSHQLASKIKRLTKHEFEKGRIRTVLTSCMNLCPKDAVAICIAPVRGAGPSVFLEADIEDLEASSEAVTALLRRYANDPRA